MKKILLLLLGFSFLNLSAGSLPDNVYFRAMSDEMQRTMKDLRVKGSAKPFFAGYKLVDEYRHIVSASLGSKIPQREPHNSLSALVYVTAGDGQENSSGFTLASQSTYKGEEGVPAYSESVPQSYEGIRRELWKLTDDAYIFASTAYDQKKAYKKRKGLNKELPDFSQARKASFLQEIPPFSALEEGMQERVNALSAQGKRLPYLEKFTVGRSRLQQRNYFLDSKGNFAQYYTPQDYLYIEASLRLATGEPYSFLNSYILPQDPATHPAQMQQIVEKTLAEIEKQYHAVREKKPYVGPVLFKKKAAASFFSFLFVPAASNTKPLLEGSDYNDTASGYFRDRKGMRVISPLFDVYDKPSLSQHQGKTLAGFMPVDDEGVKAEDLHLIQEGKLLAFPTIRSLVEGQKRSNGHARMSQVRLPRAGVSNLFFVPKETFSEKEMEEKLLQRCKEQELEYCYIVPSSFYYSTDEGVAFPKVVERIYTKDGRKEMVNGLKITGASSRTLRNILAAGDDTDVYNEYSKYYIFSTVSQAIVTPSVLVDEIELQSNMYIPDTPPVVPLP